WDRVEDRLYKIRHCQHIEGVTRQPPLFDEALGFDALSGAVRIPSLSAPLSQYRFPVLLSKAFELAGEVRALGGALLGAIERRDGEELSRMRSTQEKATLARVKEVREQQVTEAESQLAALQAGRELISFRRQHYDRLRTDGLNLHE